MIQQIAEQVASDYDRSPSDLKKKRYSKLTNINDMKQDFVGRCLDHEYNPKQIAAYLNHNSDSIYRLMPKKPKKKYEQILHELKTKGYVTGEEFSHLSQHISRLRKMGHTIYHDNGKYYLG